MTNGSAVFRRDRSHLQLGTRPGWVINDQPGLLNLLRHIDGITDSDQLDRDFGNEVDVRTILDELIHAGLIVNAAGWRGGPSSEHQANVARGTDPVPVSGRPHYRVAIVHDGATASTAACLRRLMAHSGLAAATRDDCELIVSCSLGEPDRALFRSAGEREIDQLPVVIDGSVITAGPFIRPGLWPCISCHDCHRNDWDAAWPALLEQRRVRPPGGLAVPATLVHHTAAHIVEDVIAAAEKRTPATYACTRSYGPDLGAMTRRPVPFHPACACTRLVSRTS